MDYLPYPILFVLLLGINAGLKKQIASRFVRWLVSLLLAFLGTALVLFLIGALIGATQQ